jgi:hypothetical protein
MVTSLLPTPSITSRVSEEDDQEELYTNHQYLTHGHQNHHHIVTIPPIVADVCKQAVEWSRMFWDVGVALVSMPLFQNDDSLELVSIVLLTGYTLIPYVHSILPPMEIWMFHLPDGSALPPNEVWMMFPVMWLWCAPLLLSFSIAILISSPYWWRPHQEETILMVSALVTLFFIEALLPIMILLSSTFLLLRDVDWVTGVLIMFVIWTLMMFMAHIVRCAIYQTMDR